MLFLYAPVEIMTLFAAMESYVIYVEQVEEWQMLKDEAELEAVFGKAKRCIVGGSTVELVRRSFDGQETKFAEISTLEDLTAYKKEVFKYL